MARLVFCSVASVASAALVALVACGSSPTPPAGAPAPLASEAGAAPPDAGLAAPPDAAPTASLGCKSRPTVCAEYRGLPAEDAAKLREKCAHEGGEVLDACPSEKVVATCAATLGTTTVRQIMYRAKTAKETRHLLNAARDACDRGHGAFTALP